MKYIKVLFSNGEIYHIQASIVAHERATYYADHDIGKQVGEPTKEWMDCYKKEREYTLSDDFEIIDWANNNMDWGDVEEHAILIDSEFTPVNKQHEWVNNEPEKEIVEA